MGEPISQIAIAAIPFCSNRVIDMKPELIGQSITSTTIGEQYDGC
jgi:hypothetical protein